ncbi:MAG: carbohydrate binding family 9 domain-containing protein [Bacteroidetes bacterium]|nr:carbohydrate binding family 9 domain-containing protein [Bacteroidota bacterium]
MSAPIQRGFSRQCERFMGLVYCLCLLFNSFEKWVVTVTLLFLVAAVPARAQDIFPPPAQLPEVRAIRALEPVRIDGRLDESDWQRAEVITSFTRFQPNQGGPVSLPTEVRIMFDDEYLYFGATMYDTLGRAGIRVPVIRRDFDYFENDLFSIALDGLNDGRNSMVFQTNPYGAQRELLSLDATTFNRQWQTLWVVASHIDDWGWSTEIAIPWKSIRYEEGATEMRVILMRIIRRLNERATWPALPRAMNPYRMDYGALITGLRPPPPSSNIIVNPYVLVSASEQSGSAAMNGGTGSGNGSGGGAGSGTNGGGSANSESGTGSNGGPSNMGWRDPELKAGGEIKWAIDTRSVLDVTWNTDFAQVDTDRQVLNLTRFSVQFPEQRQFFLEGNEIYTMSARDLIQPFFSRRIGLDEQGNPVALNGGARFTRRGTNQSIGGMVMRQSAGESSGAAWFTVARYTRNVNPGNRLGIMASLRHDEAFIIPSFSQHSLSNASSTNSQSSQLGEVALNTTQNNNTLPANANLTLTADGFSRFSNTVYSHYMLSYTNNTDENLLQHGWSSVLFGEYRDNRNRFQLTTAAVSDTYDPRTGFIDDRNYVMASAEYTLTLQPHWLPSVIQELEPSAEGTHFRSYDDLRFREAVLTVTPLSIIGRDASRLKWSMEAHWQNLESTFRPLGAVIPPGSYRYWLQQVQLTSDYSRRVAASITMREGGYFNGRIRTLRTESRFAPIPQLMLTGSYTFNRLIGMGANGEDIRAEIAGLESRVALNARFQWITFYQYNTQSQLHIVNSRLQWEYLPMSFLYIVLNDSRRDVADPLMPVRRLTDQQAIMKITLFRQL